MKIKTILLLLLFGLTSAEILAQEPTFTRKGAFYFYWGYNRSVYARTNLHFNGPEYDFTLYDLKGTDRPTRFGWEYFDPSRFTIPQYNFRLGYYITDRFTISLGSDHMKYVVSANQMTRISGEITDAISEKYGGAYLNQEIVLTEDLLKFEHSDGFNFSTIDLAYLQPLFEKGEFSVLLNMGIGGVWIITKTNVKVFGEGLDNDFHIAGYGLAGKVGPRVEFKNRLFLLGEIKGGYASLPSVLIKNSEPEIGDHNLSFLEYYVALGVNFKIKRRKNKRAPTTAIHP